MPGTKDANIKLLYAVDNNSFFTADTVVNGTEFDTIANVEIGADTMEVITKEELFVSVINLSDSSVLQRKTLTNQLQADSNPRNAELRVNFDANWKAAEGDILQAVATYKVTAGVHVDISTAQSNLFVVSA
jgi:hypothetical protein